MPLPPLDPPLINSANPWATTLADLQQLFDCPNTGAVTIRTSLIDGFQHDPTIHQYTFFEPASQRTQPSEKDTHPSFSGSLNTLGYSPIKLEEYLATIQQILVDSKLSESKRQTKPFIVSVTGSPDQIVASYRAINTAQQSTGHPLMMEINLSCPNIPDKPPPAYSQSSLIEYLELLSREVPESEPRVPIGLKTPPYTYHDQFQTLISALLTVSQSRCPVDFITATNTLGSCLVLADNIGVPALNSATGTGIGGMAGAPLHALALGNVMTLRMMLDTHPQLKQVSLIGIGGVSDKAGFDRMRAVGAEVVGVGTALGREGISIFSKILAAPEAASSLLRS